MPNGLIEPGGDLPVFLRGLRRGLAEYRTHRKVIHQTGILFGAQIALHLLALLAKGFQTRALGPDDYGLVAFFGVVTGFTVLFFRFGLFSSVQVLLAGSRDPQADRELFGAGFAIATALGTLYALLVFVLGFFIDNWFELAIGAVLHRVAPFCFIIPFAFLFPALAVGSNRVELSALYGVLNRLLFLIPLAILYFLGVLNVTNVIVLSLAGCLAAALYVGWRFRPSIRQLSSRLAQIWKVNREFGLKVYLGQVVNQGAMHLDKFLVAYYSSAAWLGFYTLIVALAFAILALSAAFTDAIFKRFATDRRIPRKVFLYNSLWLALGTLGLILLGKPVVLVAFSRDFMASTALILPVAVATFFQGMYQPHHRFLTARQMGDLTRNAAIWSSVAIVLADVALIPRYGAHGAAWASAASSAFSLAAYHFYYRRALARIASAAKG